jgi:formate dehydrogenase major subunit
MTLSLSFFTDERDLGTPPANRQRRGAEATVEVVIDGQSIMVEEGTSVMRAAALCGVDVPKLCATDSLDPFGSCRLCLVEIDGRKGTPASCTTPVAPGMQVTTQSPKLERLRRGVMELYISDHPLDCLTCAANGDCELQDMAGAVGLRDVRYGYAGDNHLGLEKDTSNPYFTFDSSKCIVCSRCVRACEEVQGTFALTIEGRGFGSRVAPVPTATSSTARACRAAPACRPAPPPRSPRTRHRDGPAPAHRAHHLRLLRCRLLVQGRDAGRDGRADDPRTRAVAPTKATRA